MRGSPSPWNWRRVSVGIHLFEITLVNRESFFLFTPMLHEVAASDLDLTTIANRGLQGIPGMHLDIAKLLEE